MNTNLVWLTVHDGTNPNGITVKRKALMPQSIADAMQEYVKVNGFYDLGDGAGLASKETGEMWSGPEIDWWNWSTKYFLEKLHEFCKMRQYFEAISEIEKHQSF